MTQQTEKPRILVFCDYYLPGYKSGGGMRTLVNMVERLGSKYEFRIVARDHDGKLDRTPYTTVEINTWNTIGNARVFYLSSKKLRLSTLRDLIREVRPASIYLNSFFATQAVFILLLKKLRQIRRVPVVMAPEGELSRSALAIKPLKKKLYINVVKAFRLKEGLIWKASSEAEKDDIENLGRGTDEVFVAPNLPPKSILAEFTPAIKPEKKGGEVKLIFLSRFARIKNFKWLLDLLPRTRGSLSIDLFGALEDQAYWNECQPQIRSMPERIKISHKGPVRHEDVARTMAGYHYFILPTLGESFGHVCLEALAAGCPLIVSDRTPWLGLETRGIGWDLSLEDPDKWVRVIDQCVAEDDGSFRNRSMAAREAAVSWLADKAMEAKTEQVLDYSLGKNGQAR
jgi:glycosyltransferase involved in cell wall biosynthesis